MQHVYQCGECDGMSCTLVVTCNDDDIPQVDKIPCTKRIVDTSVWWRKMEA